MQLNINPNVAANETKYMNFFSSSLKESILGLTLIKFVDKFCDSGW